MTYRHQLFKKFWLSFLLLLYQGSAPSFATSITSLPRSAWECREDVPRPHTQAPPRSSKPTEPSQNTERASQMTRSALLPFI